MTEQNEDEQHLKMLQNFIKFAEAHKQKNTGHKKISISEYNKIIEKCKEFPKLSDDKFNYNSFTYGIALGTIFLNVDIEE